MTRIYKKLLPICFKLILAASLILWMVSSGKLDFSSSLTTAAKPSVLLVCLSAWLLTAVLSNSLRWCLLVNAVGISLSKIKAIKVSLIALFFSTFLPGAVGGDLIKAIFIYKNHPGGQKTPAMLTIVLDRILGLCGLFLIACPVVLLRWEHIKEASVLLSLGLTTIFISAAMIIFILGVFMPWKKGADPFLKLLQWNIFGFSFLRKIYEALRIYKNKPRAVFLSVLISMFSQSVLMFAIIFITMELTPQPVDLWQLVMVMPLGILATALPLAPGGLGVGHVAFGTLFHMIGLEQGANVYNVYFLTVSLPNLLGVIPYFLSKDAKLNYSKAAS